MSKPFRVGAALAVLASAALIAIVTAPAAEAATVATLAPVVISSPGNSNVACVTASTDGATVNLEGCHTSFPVRMWFVPKPLPTGVQFSAANNPTRCLSVPNSSTAANVRLVLEPCANAARMIWSISESREITYDIRNVNSGLCLQKSLPQGYPVQHVCIDDWHVSPVGTVKFRAQHSGKCLDVDDAGGATVSGALAQQWTCVPAALNQQFRLTLQALPLWSGGECYPSCGSAHVRPAVYRLSPVHSNMCLAHNNVFANGTRVRQRTCGSQPEIWTLYPMDISSGRQIFKIKQQLTNGPERNTCVDVNNATGGLADGEKVQIYQCLDGQTNQLWALFQVTTV